MVDLSGGQDGPIEHGFSNTVFIIPGIIFITLSDNIQITTMDLLQGVKDMEGNIAMTQGEGEAPQIPNMEDMKMPTLDELLKALDGMTGMSEEDKQELREQLMNPSSLPMHQQTGFGWSQFFTLMALILIVAFIFVFFGYKLYKSLADKERKRDEKRKMKQMKKKK